MTPATTTDTATVCDEVRKQLGMAAAKIRRAATCPVCGTVTEGHFVFANRLDRIADGMGGALQERPPRKKSARKCLKSATYMLKQASSAATDKELIRQLQQWELEVATAREAMAPEPECHEEVT